MPHACGGDDEWDKPASDAFNIRTVFVYFFGIGSVKHLFEALHGAKVATGLEYCLIRKRFDHGNIVEGSGWQLATKPHNYVTRNRSARGPVRFEHLASASCRRDILTGGLQVSLLAQNCGPVPHIQQKVCRVSSHAAHVRLLEIVDKTKRGGRESRSHFHVMCSCIPMVAGRVRV